MGRVSVTPVTASSPSGLTPYQSGAPPPRWPSYVSISPPHTRSIQAPTSPCATRSEPCPDLICSAVLSRGHGEAAPGWLRGRRFWWPDQVDELACVSVLDGAVRLIFAGWLPQDGLFGWNASAGLKVERGAGVMNPLAAHRSNADRSSRGRLLIVLVRLLWGVGGRRFRGGFTPGRGGSFLDPGNPCRCVGGVNVEHAQRSEHERR